MRSVGQKEKRTSKKNVDGRSTSSHDNKKYGTRSLEKQRGMAFGFRKTATAVKKSDREIVGSKIWMDGQTNTHTHTLPHVCACTQQQQQHGDLMVLMEFTVLLCFLGMKIMPKMASHIFLHSFLLTT